MPERACCGWSGGDLALPERALLRSPRGSRTQVHSPRFSLAKPARLCDITAYKLGWSMCRLTATGVVVMCAAYAAYERLTALFGVCGCVRRVLSCLYIDNPVGIAPYSNSPLPYPSVPIRTKPPLQEELCSAPALRKGVRGTSGPPRAEP